MPLKVQEGSQPLRPIGWRFHRLLYEYLQADFEDTESIYSKPPSKPVIITAVGLLLFTLCMVIWSSVSFVDKTVATRGKFTNTAPNIEIQSTGSSFIEELNLERGQHVSKGETIAKLDGTVVNANLKIVKDKISAVKNKIVSQS